MDFEMDKVLKGVADYRAEGQTAEMNAALSGSMHDGGGGRIKAVADAYIAGLNKQIPDWLAKQIEESEKIDMQERAEYERLKAKFKD